MSRSLSIPKAMQPTCQDVVELTDRVCRDHLDHADRDLARAMAASCRKRPGPMRSGQPRSRACGIVRVPDQLDVLSDPGIRPCMTTAGPRAAFDVGQSTAGAKARAISNALHPQRTDPTWRRSDLVDLRHVPREVQVIACEQGLIPDGPDERDGNVKAVPG